MINKDKIAESLEECEQLAEAWRDEIINAPDNIRYTGTAYYISNRGDDSNDGTSPNSAWASLKAYAANMDQFKPGDAVLFERGSVFRLFDMMKMHNGMTYGAYGSGNKPMLLGSEYNYAQVNLWSKYSDNIWKCTLEDSWDAGNIVFDEGKFFGHKRRYLKDLFEEFDFCHIKDEKALYLFLKECPSQRFYDIEIGRRFHILQCFSSTDIRIDNLCLKYGGAHGISLFDVKNVQITNCEIGWIGGAYHSYNYEAENNLCRFGNGIEDYGNCHDFTIKGCWVYQCYDAGITNQGRNSEHNNILYENNLLENNVWNIEFWVGKGDIANITNMTIKSNFLRYGGYSWGYTHRTENNTSSQINCWINYWPNAKNINICSNIFEGKYRNAFWWRWTTTENHPGLDIYDNTFYNNGTFRMNFGVTCIYARNQEQMEKNICEFDRNPRAVRIFDLQE